MNLKEKGNSGFEEIQEGLPTRNAFSFLKNDGSKLAFYIKLRTGGV